MSVILMIHYISAAQSPKAVEYTDCISADECLAYNIKQTDGEPPGQL